MPRFNKKVCIVGNHIFGRFKVHTCGLNIISTELGYNKYQYNIAVIVLLYIV